MLFLMILNPTTLLIFCLILDDLDILLGVHPYLRTLVIVGLRVDLEIVF